MKEITSAQNDTIKRVSLYIDKSRDRKKDGVFVAEGIRENTRAIQSGFKPKWIFFSTVSMTLDEVLGELGINEHDALFHSCSDSAFQKIALRHAVPNIVGVFERRDHGLDDIDLPKDPLILVAESIEKPGNLGAILRTCSAAGVNALLIADAVVDIYHPQVIRNSLGGFFDVPFISASSDEIIAYLKKKGINIEVTYLEGADAHYDVDLKNATAIVVGPEDKGVSSPWLKAASHRIKIPMEGVVDSLNVSVAAAIMLFEAKRQRAR